MRRSVALLALLLAAVPALAQDKVTLKTKHAEGDTFDVRESMKLRVAGSVQGQAMSMKLEAAKEYREKTLAIKDGLPLRAERTYKTDEETTEQKAGGMPAESETKKNAIVGKTIVLVKKDGKVVAEAKPEEGDLDEELGFATDDIDVLLPDGPVAVGDEWKVAGDKLSTAFGKDGPKAAEATCTLEEVAEKGGAKVARIAVKMTMKGGNFSGDLAGPFLFDLSANRPLSIALKGAMKMNMGTAAFEGPMEVESTITPVK